MREGRLFDARHRRIADRVRSLLDGDSEAAGAEAAEVAAADVLAPAEDPSRRGALLIGAAVILAAVLTGGWVLAGRPHVDAMPAGPATPVAVHTSPMSSSSSPRSSSAAVIVVDVVGKVRRPGVYRLTTGARVDDALRAAGGTLPGVDEATVNRAARIADGQQIVVGARSLAGAGVAPTGADDRSPGAVTAPVNINSASSSELQQLPGVGPVLAQHIVDWRTAHGSFANIDQLQSVSGIGPAKFAAIKGLVSL